jgi:hypothetical protein
MYEIQLADAFLNWPPEMGRRYYYLGCEITSIYNPFTDNRFIVYRGRGNTTLNGNTLLTTNLPVTERQRFDLDSGPIQPASEDVELLQANPANAKWCHGCGALITEQNQAMHMYEGVNLASHVCRKCQDNLTAR